MDLPFNTGAPVPGSNQDRQLGESATQARVVTAECPQALGPIGQLRRVQPRLERAIDAATTTLVDIALALRTIVVPTEARSAGSGGRDKWTYHVQAAGGIVAAALRSSGCLNLQLRRGSRSTPSLSAS